MDINKLSTYAREQWDAWYDSRPETVRALIDQVPPGKYLVKSTGQIAHVRSYREDGTISVNIIGEDENPYCVFGYTPADLERIPGDE